MAEPTITLAYTDLAQEVGRFLGYGRDSANWSSDQAADVDVCVQGGYRMFLFPPPIPPEREPHRWTFMTPVATLSTVSGDSDYNMPDDFAGLDGSVGTYSAEAGYSPINIISEAGIRDLLASADTSGRPIYCATRPKTFDAATGQRWELLLYPEPDAAYSITYRYTVMPNKLSAGNPYPLGGPMHGDTIMAAVLAFAAKRFNDESDMGDFMMRLTASVSLDTASHSAFSLGYNGDNSDSGGLGLRSSRSNTVTYNGVQYD